MSIPSLKTGVVVGDAVKALDALPDTPGVLGMRDAATNLLSALDR